MASDLVNSVAMKAVGGAVYALHGGVTWVALMGIGAPAG
jgi:hypothetical protein